MPIGIHVDLDKLPAAAFLWKYSASNYTDLVTNVAPVANEGELAVVYSSQGVWPNRKLSGVYIYQSGVWEYGNQELQDILAAKIDSVVGGMDITVDNTDPLNPVINYTGSSAQSVQSDWAQTDDLEGDYIQNKPSDITDLSVHSATELFDLDNVGSGQIITDGERLNLNNQSGTNTGDEDTASIQSKRPLKTIEGQSLEGVGDIDLSSKYDASNPSGYIDAAGAPVQPSDIANFETSTELDARDVTNRDRSNHLGTQTVSTISDFDSGVATNPDVLANTSKQTNATHTGDVTGAQALTISDNAVNNDKAADMPPNTVKVNNTASLGNPVDIEVGEREILLRLVGEELKSGTKEEALSVVFSSSNEGAYDLDTLITPGLYTGNGNITNQPLGFNTFSRLKVFETSGFIVQQIYDGLGTNVATRRRHAITLDWNPWFVIGSIRTGSDPDQTFNNDDYIITQEWINTVSGRVWKYFGETSNDSGFWLSMFDKLKFRVTQDVSQDVITSASTDIVYSATPSINDAMLDITHSAASAGISIGVKGIYDISAKTDIQRLVGTRRGFKAHITVNGSIVDESVDSKYLRSDSSTSCVINPSLDQYVLDVGDSVGSRILRLVGNVTSTSTFINTTELSIKLIRPILD